MSKKEPMVLFKIENEKIEWLAMNEWELPKRNPINISLLTIDFIYMEKVCPLCLTLVKMSGVKIGLLGIIMLFFKKEKH